MTVNFDIFNDNDPYCVVYPNGNCEKQQACNIIVISPCHDTFCNV